jgi:hypothetical protein
MRDFIVHSDNITIHGSYPKPFVVSADSGPELLQKSMEKLNVKSSKLVIHVWSGQLGIVGRIRITDMAEIPENIIDVWLRAEN